MGLNINNRGQIRHGKAHVNQCINESVTPQMLLPIRLRVCTCSSIRTVCAGSECNTHMHQRPETHAPLYAKKLLSPPTPPPAPFPLPACCSKKVFHPLPPPSLLPPPHSLSHTLMTHTHDTHSHAHQCLHHPLLCCHMLMQPLHASKPAPSLAVGLMPAGRASSSGSAASGATTAALSGRGSVALGAAAPLAPAAGEHGSSF